MNLIDKAKDLLHDDSLRGRVPDRVMVVLRELAALEPVEDFKLDDLPISTLETRHD